MKRLLALALACSACASDQISLKQDRSVDAITLDPLPSWTDRSYDAYPGNPDPPQPDQLYRRFNLSETMERYGFTRLQALELQNRYLDLNDADPFGDAEPHFRQALEETRAGKLESGLDANALAQAKVIVAFDLDATLYDQRSASEDCFDLRSLGPDLEPHYIKLLPGIEAGFRRLKAMGAAIVLYSANDDAETARNLDAWLLSDGTPIKDSGLIAGVLTNHHLVLQSKLEGEGAQAIKKGLPITALSKDLRVLDESLERVLIIDDNPRRLFQFRNLRLVKKFRAHELCDHTERSQIWQKTFDHWVDEIAESLDWATKHGTTFVDAYLPYSLFGRIAFEFAVEQMQLSPSEARDYLRQNPDFIDQRF